jgi:signal transduction protein with GAF and PtsI domain
MQPDDDPQALLATLEAEQRELLGEADALRRFIACMRTLIDAARPRQDISEVYSVLEHVLDNAIRAVNARDGSILVPDRRTRELVFVIVRGDEPHIELVGRRLSPGEGIAGWVAENRRPAIVNNATADDRFFPGMDRELAYKTHSILAAPLVGAGRMLGVVEVLNKRDGRFFSIGNKTLLNLMCRFAGEMLYTMVRDLDLSRTDLSRIALNHGT